MFPLQVPVDVPTHQTISLLVSNTGDGGLLKLPVAVIGIWPFG